MKSFAIALAALGLSTVSAFAHATYEAKTVEQGSTAKIVLRVPHGCGSEATLKVRIQIPEGIISVKPMPKAGWTLDVVTGDYANTYEAHGKKVTRGVKEIIWTGELPDAFYDEFTFRGQFTDKLPVDQMVYIPAVQECATGTARWVNIPAEGQDPHDLEDPAPGVKVIAPEEHHHH